MSCDVNNALPDLVICCFYVPWAPSMPFPEVHPWCWQTGAADSSSAECGAEAVGTHTCVQYQLW